MTGIFAGMAAMAALAIWLRGRGADPRLAPAVACLALFALGLAALLALDGSAWEDWQVLVLPPLPVLLAQHVRSLAGPARWPRIEAALATSGLLCLPFLLMPTEVRAALEAGLLPTISPLWLLVALAGVGLFWLALCLGTALAGIGILRALKRHAKALAQIIAAPPTPRLSGVALLGTFLAALFAIQLLDLLSLGRVLIGPLSDLFLFALILGTALHGLTLRMHWPDWADAVIAATETPPALPSYARSGLDAEAMAQLLGRIDAAMRRDSLWRAPGLSLADLAEAARAKPFYVSQALNQGRAESFYDYVNGWRVREAQELLRATDHTVLDIAHATGFNAKSTFNAAFLKRTGMTPSRWRASGPIGPVAGGVQS
ncbi:helix-turn-helix protein [Rhodobacter viridis]|uniref:Helix-turn-helix protein n=1 Tax=Rhodobacter viridis TaxID=1054202 RepID=A0A318TTS8_9RHOB|nr:helix-turn-helix transcriptional regulator [Rhodobacter viridis]PYF07763.1 helix-turn-helix protein [Rhodobacter viridis]